MFSGSDRAVDPGVAANCYAEFHSIHSYLLLFPSSDANRRQERERSRTKCCLQRAVVGGNVHLFAVHHDVPVADQLSGCTCRCDHTVDHIVQTRFTELQKVFTGDAFLPRGLFEGLRNCLSRMP